MAWYLILLIIVGCLLVLIGFFLLIKKATKPKFKDAKKYLETQQQIEKIEEKKEQNVASPIGLNLNSVYNDEEESFYSQDAEEISDFNFEKFNPPKKQEPKSLLEQIRELSPELKMLIFDRGLARKDYDFKSKKD